MVYQYQIGWNLHVKLDDRSSTCGEKGCLHVIVSRASAFNVDLIKYLTNDVESRYEVRATVTNHQPSRFTPFGSQATIAGQCSPFSVEYDVRCVLVVSFLPIKG